jgi:hypothetical protein
MAPSGLDFARGSPRLASLRPISNRGFDRSKSPETSRRVWKRPASRSSSDTAVQPESLARREFHKRWDLHRNSGAPGMTRTCDTRLRKPGYHYPATYRNHIVVPDSRSGSLSTFFYSLRLASTLFATTMERSQPREGPVSDGHQHAVTHPGTQRKQWVPALRNHAREERNLAVPRSPTTTRCAPSGASREREPLLVAQAAVEGVRRRAIRNAACHRKAQ